MDETRIDILAETGEIIDYCYGPNAAGQCPRAKGDRTVPCNGHRIAPLGAGPEFWLLYVPPASQHCPTAWNLKAVGF